jgi:hypothetical protein
MTEENKFQPFKPFKPFNRFAMFNTFKAFKPPPLSVPASRGRMKEGVNRAKRLNAPNLGFYARGDQRRHR